MLQLVLAAIALPLVAQQAGTEVAGAVTVTNKGISLVPALTLGRPAAILDVSIRRRAVGFEPQFRVALDGKPWSFIFWWRYRSPQTDKLRLLVGAHPAFLFRTIPVSAGGVQKNVIVARRYVAGELYPSYAVANNLDLGIYYLYSHGIDRDAIRNTHFVAARLNVTNVHLPGRYFLQFSPQVYYLRMAGQDGVYAYSTVTLADRKLPVSISALINQPIQSRIVGGQDFLWNVSLTYSIK